MHIVFVTVQVKPDSIDAFRAATVKNASASIKEPGIARFDVLQQSDDPSRFILIETYRNADDPPKHRETSHYKEWRDAVEPMMASPRTRLIFDNVFPDDKDWD